MKITLTEALNEIKLIDKKVDSEAKTIMTYITRSDALKDPLQKDGGSPNVLKGRKQAIGDLLTRKVMLRLAINQANLSTMLKIGQTEKSVAGWIVWRREASDIMKDFLTKMRMKITQDRISYQKTQTKEGEKNADMVVNLDELALNDEAMTLKTTLGELDGKLSLHNATTTVEV